MFLCRPGWSLILLAPSDSFALASQIAGINRHEPLCLAEYEISNGCTHLWKRWDISGTNSCDTTHHLNLPLAYLLVFFWKMRDFSQCSVNFSLSISNFLSPFLVSHCFCNWLTLNQGQLKKLKSNISVLLWETLHWSYWRQSFLRGPLRTNI